MGDKIIDMVIRLVESGAVMQAVITAAVMTVYLYLVGTGIIKPDTLGELSTLVVGFWMGGQAKNKVANGDLAALKQQVSELTTYINDYVQSHQ